VSKEQIVKSAYLYANKDIPCALLVAIVEHVSNFDPLCTKAGHVGLMGITYEQATIHGKVHLQMFDPKLNLEVGAKELKRLLGTARCKLPSAKVDEWYLLAISAFINGGKIGRISVEAGKIWEEVKASNKYAKY
jgi:hypothetical protein